MKRFNVLQSLAVLFVFSLMGWGLVPSVVLGAVPQLINFQGILKDGSGNPVADGSYSVVFTIYDAPTGGSALWAETKSVATANGLFNTLLGSVALIPGNTFDDPARYLGIKVGADPEMTPRQQISSTGYSYVSSQWTSAGANLFKLNGNVGIGTTAPLTKLDVRGDILAGSEGTFVEVVAGIASNSPSAYASLAMTRSRGTILFPTPVQNGDLLGVITFAGQTGFNFGEGNRACEIKSVATENWSSGNQGSTLDFYTVPNGSTQNFSRMRIDQNGNVGIGTQTPSEKLEVAGNVKIGNATTRSGTGSPEGAVTGNVGDLFLRTDGGAGSTFYVKESGNGTNTGWAAK